MMSPSRWARARNRSLVVGLVIYAATVERRREYGMLKALGAPNRMLYSVVGFQAAAAALVSDWMAAVAGAGREVAAQRSGAVDFQLTRGLLGLTT